MIKGLKYVADEINNTPSVAKKNYVNNELIDMYLNDVNTFNKLFKNNKKINIQFSLFLSNVVIHRN